MSRNMLKWRSRRRYRLRDTPYAPLVESPDTKTGDTKRRYTTAALQNIRSSDKSEVMISAQNFKNDVNPNTDTRSLEQSSFVTISSEDLNFEDSDPVSEQSQRMKRNTFRRFSESSVTSVAKMTNKWSKIRDSFFPVRNSLSTLPEVINNTGGNPKNGFVKPGAAISTSGKNPSQRIKRASRQRRWSLFSTNYVKLDNSDSSPSMPFDLENIAHSTFIHESKNIKTDKDNSERALECPAAAEQLPVGEKVATDTSLGCIPKHTHIRDKVSKKRSLHENKRNVSNPKKRAVRTSARPNISSEKNIQRIKRKRLQGNIGTARLPKTRRDSYSLKTLSVKSSEGKVEVKISLELSDPTKKYESSSSGSSRCGVTNKYYLRSSVQRIITTPVLPKRPLSRRSLFSDRSSNRDSITDREREVTSYDKERRNDSSVAGLNTEQSAKDTSLHLSPRTGATDHVFTPPNERELTLSIEKIVRQRPRKQRRVRC